MTQLRDESRDDLDRLFSRLEPSPLPSDFTQRLMDRTASVPQPRQVQTRPLVFVYAVTLLLLGGAAYEAGRGISGGRRGGFALGSVQRAGIGDDGPR